MHMDNDNDNNQHDDALASFAVDDKQQETQELLRASEAIAPKKAPAPIPSSEQPLSAEARQALSYLKSGLPPAPATRGEKRSRRRMEEEDEIPDRLPRKVANRVEKERLRRGLVRSLRGWESDFPEKVKPVLQPHEPLDKLDANALEMLESEVQSVVGEQNSTAVSSKMAIGLVSWIQDGLSEFTPLKVDGPKLKLVDMMQSKEAQDLTKELSRIYAKQIYVNPWVRAGTFLGNACTLIHKINTEATASTTTTTTATATPAAPAAATSTPPAKPVDYGPGKDKNGFELPPQEGAVPAEK